MAEVRAVVLQTKPKKGLLAWEKRNAQTKRKPSSDKCVQRLFLTLLLLFCLSSSAYCIDTDFQSWSIVTAKGSLAKESPWKWYLEAQPRVGDDAQRLERNLLRAAVGYVIEPGIALWLGYGWTPLFVDPQFMSNFQYEHRIFEQLTIDGKLESVVLSHRLRLEHRFIEGVQQVSNRLRCLLRGSQEIVQVIDGTQFGITGYNEIFLNLNQSSGPTEGFDRNRFFIGPYIKQEMVRFEVGFLGEYSIRRNNSDRMISALGLGLAFDF